MACEIEINERVFIICMIAQKLFLKLTEKLLHILISRIRYVSDLELACSQLLNMFAEADSIFLSLLNIIEFFRARTFPALSVLYVVNTDPNRFLGNKACFDHKIF